VGIKTINRTNFKTSHFGQSQRWAQSRHGVTNPQNTQGIPAVNPAWGGIPRLYFDQPEAFW